MRIVILGGGVVGVTTAYQLQRDGHEVVVLDRCAEVAAETSWGNAGMVAPGHSFVWSSPAAPMTLLKSLFLRDQALRFRFSADPHLYAWSLRFLAQCTADRARRNTLLKHRLAAYSQSVLHEVLGRETIVYDRSDRGILYVHRSAQALERGIAQMRLLESDGQVVRVLDRTGLAALDPVLGAAPGVVGAIHCPTDETGDPALFTRALAGLVAARGGEIATRTTITGIETDGRAVTGIRTGGGRVTGDAYVLALGSYSPILARRIGIRLPIYPIKGYALTIPIGGHAHPPAIASVDEHHLVAISRFGDRLRVTATAAFSGYDVSHKPSDFTFMTDVVRNLYPDGADYARAQMWAGLRPMTPTNLPLFGRARYRNLYLNTGHGHIGWTMSHGSARITADLIAGRRPALPMDGLLATRAGHAP
ncbi:D-amino acid dehydrogenase [Gluconacetobacter azotocaptans]|uniref:D-amino acid dehydrogenase n=1 Tax=Gluconacetobacter azotocaptans TaxID=142834 RepID=A0A7W4PFF8_9PROT|nr:D-amino acid dehydrogenase [Gluconacetobacter azotocaptans]MBB2188851.1 D-amino acid dehydrogenase [Gluconacetobacter azotocaptans]GBQ31232.1 glycine/D-amino acid oxidase [Gluconacetobacter azotocaptans DSM 13594]